MKGILILFGIAVSNFLFLSVSQATTNLRFDWGAAQAEVTETILKGGNEIKVKYLIKVEASGENFIVRQSDTELITFNGVKSEDPRVLSIATSALLYPDIIVDSSGMPFDVVDFGNYTTRMGEVMSLAKGVEYGKKYVAFLEQNEEIQQAVIQKVFERWCVWVCNWVNENISAEEPWIDVVQTSLGTSSIPMMITLTHHGQYESSDNIRLTFESRMGDEETMKAIDKFWSSLKLDGEENMSANALDDWEANDMRVEKKTTLEAVTLPGTLQPSFIEYHTKVRMTSAEGMRTEEESRTYSFSW